MMKDFKKRVENWNKRNKARSEAMLLDEEKCEDTSKEISKPSSQPETFSRQVYEWNEHFKHGKQPEPISNPEDSCSNNKESLGNDVYYEEDEEYDDTVDIAQKVGEWDNYYKTIKRHSTNRQSAFARLQRSYPGQGKGEPLTEKVNKWELFYQPTRSNKENSKRVNRRHSHLLSMTDEKMTELVTQWNQHYTTSGKKSTDDNLSQPQKGSRLNRVTSLLVQRWDDHYVAIKQKSSRQATKPDVDRKQTTSNKSETPRNKSTTSNLKRTPSLVRARVEEYATQAEDIYQQRQRAKCQEIAPMIKSRQLCRGNIEELKSKFSITCYDPKSIQRICS